MIGSVIVLFMLIPGLAQAGDISPLDYAPPSEFVSTVVGVVGGALAMIWVMRKVFRLIKRG